MTIEAMKQALEALEYFSDTSPTMAGKAHAEDAITTLRTAIEVAEREEPVAWMYPDDYERMLTSETFCTVYSVEVGSATRGETTIALYAKEKK